MSVFRAVTFGLIAAAIYGCSAGGDTAVPRRTAYPRIAAYDSAYTSTENLPVKMDINSAAVVTTETKDDGSIWVNVRYPRYDATVYCTLTPVNENTVEAVLDNRAERLHRNIGSAAPTIEDGVNDGGYYTNLVLTPSVVTTPVQFIGVNQRQPRWVLSGSAFFDKASTITSVDSVMPMIDVLVRDVRVMLNSLADK